MKKIWELIKRWLNLDHQRPWEKKPPSWEDTAPSEYEPPMQESDWFIDSIPLNEHPPNSNEYHSPLPTGGEMHEKMYRMATEKGGSWIGGSENQQGGSEKLLNSN